jgi:phenylalanyl-tRNA synthetase alpha chain
MAPSSHALPVDTWKNDILTCASPQALEDVRIRLLGKSGILTEELKKLGQLSVEEKRERGAYLNQVRDMVNTLISGHRDQLQDEELNKRLALEVQDLTLPHRPMRDGFAHLLSQVMVDIQTYFQNLGFEMIDGPEVDHEYYNFDALNIPKTHPARQSHDTFYVKGLPNTLLRTHTSNTQIHALKNQKPPVRMLSLGRVYRSDNLDATHTPMFHQIEGLVLEPNIHMGHLKGCLISFLEHFFQVNNLPARFRPNFFPFTEPSAEMDILCGRHNGQLKIGTGDQWLEILGCGMVHPQVLENCGLNPDEVQGFAFGVGLERLVMLKYGIPDIRYFYESDQRWLRYYGSKSL